MKHYVLMPGYAYSPSDGDKHWITWQQLQRLYELERYEFSVFRGYRRDNSPILDPVPPPNVELVYLRPSDTGQKYGRPQ